MGLKTLVAKEEEDHQAVKTNPNKQLLTYLIN